MFITPNQINKIPQTFKGISKVRLVLERKNLIDYALLYCEVNKNSSETDLNIKNFFKNEFKINTEVEFVDEGSISNDGIVIEDKRVNN